MITRPTVLVLGAGASVPYHMPTGAQLFERLVASDVEKMPPGAAVVRFSSAAERVLSWGFAQEDELVRFTKRLARSGEESVDAFLAHQPPEIVRIGKFMIAAELSKKERGEHLFEHARVADGPWYRWLWKQLDHRPDRLSRNRLTIVTFNYDRSLEYFLVEALRHGHDVPLDEAQAIVDGLRIIHVHGHLGRLGDNGKDARPYEPARSNRDLEIAASGIIVISEVTDVNADFEAARIALSDAARVYFLGFGYDPSSLRRLGFNETFRLSPATLGGSTFRMTPAEIDAARDHFRATPFLAGSPDQNMLEYLRHIPRLDR